ncbi:GTP-binding protein [Sedimentitalea sp. JM2-8]|uniref:GTP-binding protein n=1 Tax=Sedimentitalea xiamensis TaxID=3050037 RepID=A0ABT7FEG7_9RHOB|nr:CobW family GTP-binding protein [Sedimentitalea xiamensis]MDK3073521.1 GTP-binding protein [Sedimentitalea xiamensis]
MTAPLPLTILGGFLGAGKTTLVNHLLRHAEGRRLAVLVNEFGELPIDEDLIEAEGDDLISISGGCVCCSYGSDLTAALMDLARMEPRPDHVLLESSGVAIPGAIAATVGLLQGYRLDGIVVLADAETLRATAADRYMGDTVTRQLEDADLVVLNKCDLVTGAELSALRGWLQDRHAGLRQVEARQAAVDPAVVLGGFDGAPVSARTPENPVQSRHLRLDGPVDDPAALAGALAQDRLGLIRAKGFVTDRAGARFLIQVVGRRAACTPAPGPVSAPDGIVCLGAGGRADWPAVLALGARTSEEA